MAAALEVLKNNTKKHLPEEMMIAVAEIMTPIKVGISSFSGAFRRIFKEDSNKLIILIYFYRSKMVMCLSRKARVSYHE